MISSPYHLFFSHLCCSVNSLLNSSIICCVANPSSDLRRSLSHLPRRLSSSPLLCLTRSSSPQTRKSGAKTKDPLRKWTVSSSQTSSPYGGTRRAERRLERRRRRRRRRRKGSAAHRARRNLSCDVPEGRREASRPIILSAVLMLAVTSRWCFKSI